MSKKINLFIVGAAKSGTTSLAELFKKHPEVFVSQVKEPFFFIENYGVSDINKYHDLYKGGENKKYRLDASTGYLYDAQACRKIFDYNKEAKILIVLRNPIDFVVSYWEYMIANGNERLPLEVAIEDAEQARRETDDFKRSCEQWPANYLYVKRGLFYEQVKNFIEQFGSKNVKVSFFEDLVREQSKLIEIYNFLGLQLGSAVELPRANKSGNPIQFIHWFRFSNSLKGIKSIVKTLLPNKLNYWIRNFIIRNGTTQKEYKKYKISGSTRNYLHEKFSDDVRKLKELLPELDFSVWQDFK